MIQESEAEAAFATAHSADSSVRVRQADPDLETDVHDGTINSPRTNASLRDMSCIGC